MTTARQPMTTFILAETAKRLLSSSTIRVMADSVVISNRFDDDGFQAVQFASDGSAVDGRWQPARDWDYPTDIMEGEPGTFTAL